MSFAIWVSVLSWFSLVIKALIHQLYSNKDVQSQQVQKLLLSSYRAKSACKSVCVCVAGRNIT